jgi:hypothetical protein
LPILFLLPPFIPPVEPGPLPPPSLVWFVGPQHHGFCTQSLLKSTFFKMFQFGADSNKLMVFLFLLRSPVILLFLRYLIFQKNTFSMLVPIWDPLGPPKKSIDHFWHPLDAALAPEHASRTASGPSKNRSKQKIELLKNTWDFPQKLSPGELLAIQAPPQTGPMDLHTRPEGPLRAS